MTSASTVPVTSATLDVSGAHLYYEVRGQGPLVVLVAAPMDARSFAPLADLLAVDHTVLTTDPRGINRSIVDDRDLDATVELRADDIASLISHVDAGPAATFGSSGGAVSVLAHAQAYPKQVQTVIAHEPPLHAFLDDRVEIATKTDAMLATFHAGDRVESMRMFLEIANIPMPEPVFQAVFGGEPDAQSLADERFQNEHMLLPSVRWEADVPALRSGPTRVVVGIGEDSSGQLCDRSSRALAASLGSEPSMFPGGHIGFAEDHALFAARLRKVLGEG